ncbi:GNAT family N-acetyltransferase [Pseudomonas sp. NPDC089534]|uniref:GNAT family N-acetyltransferase n=1 Tax=Pseudomonas sp. NPDC089534 TaxID=3364468 RepID=UPI0037F386AF
MPVTLVPMDDADFTVFTERAVEEYAQGMAASGEWSVQEAPQRSSAAFTQLLEHGRQTAGHRLWVIKDGERRIGELWIAQRHVGTRSIAFILDVYIEPGERRHGYARQSMLAAEDWARRHGCEEMRLHVFGRNAPARRLYEQLGYDIASLSMAKPLPPA